MNCTSCSNGIEADRLEVLPDTTFCSHCAHRINTPRPRGVVHFDGKTGGTLQIMSKENFQQYRKYNPYGRNTGRGSGIHRVSRTTSSM